MKALLIGIIDQKQKNPNRKYLPSQLKYTRLEKHAAPWEGLEKWIDEHDPAIPENSDAVHVLAKWINEAIQADFNRLVQWLYQLDVNESLLKKTLRENSETDAGLLIAQLAIARMRQKKLTRKQSSSDWEETD
jgi:hypothetical protein